MKADRKEIEEHYRRHCVRMGFANSNTKMYRVEDVIDATEKLLESLSKAPEKEEEKEDFCPNCKSKNIKKVELRKNNGICGPGFSSWVVDSYYSCKDCGIRFD